MEKLQLNHEVSLSRIVQGLWRLTSWNMSSQEIVDFVYQCIDLGVTSFDTAEIYGNYEAERVFGEALKLDPSLRSKIEIITKTGINMKSVKRDYRIGHYDTTYNKIIASCKKSIELMNCEYLDVYLIHREDPLIDHKEVARALNDLKSMGLIKSYGVSNFDPFKFEALQHFTNNQLVTNQIEISPLCFEHFNSGMMDVLQKHEVHPMIWSPLAGGEIFTSDDEKAVKVRNILKVIADRHQEEMDTIVYAWLLKHPTKGLPISGSGKIERLKNAVRALDVELSLEEWYEIYTASQEQELR
jgi:predicted oxidoreductase